MANPFRALWRRVRQRWAEPDDGVSVPPSGLLIHDPAATRPHDLDDAFFDQKIQARVAGIIADAVRKAPDKS